MSAANAAINDLILALESTDESDRCCAIEDLGLLKDRDTIPYLIKAIDDGSTRVREASIDALISIGGNGVVTEMILLLESEDVSLRNAAINILEQL
ncbi:MAG: HEAT repeat domain-containing protein, partial [Oligoflexia bacterium]|nr:HEAT repeat domain-containing protein [Oligoflexia bacterium]